MGPEGRNQQIVDEKIQRRIQRRQSIGDSGVIIEEVITRVHLESQPKQRVDHPRRLAHDEHDGDDDQHQRHRLVGLHTLVVLDHVLITAAVGRHEA